MYIEKECANFYRAVFLHKVQSWDFRDMLFWLEIWQSSNYAVEWDALAYFKIFFGTEITKIPVTIIVSSESSPLDKDPHQELILGTNVQATTR